MLHRVTWKREGIYSICACNTGTVQILYIILLKNLMCSQLQKVGKKNSGKSLCLTEQPTPSSAIDTLCHWEHLPMCNINTAGSMDTESFVGWVILDSIRPQSKQRNIYSSSRSMPTHRPSWHGVPSGATETDSCHTDYTLPQ